MKKALVTLFCFPILFVYYVGKIVATSFGLKDSRAVPAIFTVLVLLGLGYGVWSFARPEDPYADLPEDPEGIFFLPGQGSNSVMSVTMLESALYSFFQKYKREPTNFVDLERSRIIPDFPPPKPGHKYQLDLQWPVIREVPEGTPDLESDALKTEEKSN